MSALMARSACVGAPTWAKASSTLGVPRRCHADSGSIGELAVAPLRPSASLVRHTPVAQLVRALRLHRRGRPFESDRV